MNKAVYTAASVSLQLGRGSIASYLSDHKLNTLLIEPKRIALYNKLPKGINW